MHQEHSCLLCRKTPQCHAGKSSHCILMMANKVFPALPLLLWVGGNNDVAAAVNEVLCCVSSGSGDQGHNSHPHHGDPLWGGYVGHQTGLCEGLRKVPVHSHLSKTHKSHFADIHRFFLFMYDIFNVLHLFFRVIPLGITRSCFWSCVAAATKIKEDKPCMRTLYASALKPCDEAIYYLRLSYSNSLFLL